MLTRIFAAISLIFFAITVSGCATRVQSFSEKGMDYGFYRRVALLPLENHSEEEFADERVADILSTAIMQRGLFEIVQKGDLDLFLREEVPGRDVTSLDKETGGKLAKLLKVDAYISGSVDSYETVRNGSYSYPVVAATIRMVDTESGRIIWQANGSETGYSTSQRIFGMASEDIHQVSLRLMQKLLQTMQ